MAITKLDDVAALVVIDLQKGLTAMVTAHPMAEVVARAAELAKAFRERSLPVVLVNVAGGAPGRTEFVRPKMTLAADWAELVPELGQQPEDLLITKQRWGGFIGTRLDEVLRERGVTQVVMAGVATSVGVESTARSAFDLGYNVALVVDAMTDRDGDAHRWSAEKIFPRLGETDSTENVLKLMRG